jgi:hypothetical protein
VVESLGVDMRLRIVVSVLILVVVLPLLAWTGVFLHWDFKIRGAIRTFVAESVGSGYYFDHSEAGRTLREAGCRSYPYLVSALQAPEHQEALTNALDHLIGWRNSQGQLEGKEYIAAVGVTDRARISPGDTPKERSRKAALIRKWWAERGPRLHPWWRVWSSECDARTAR